MKPVKLWLGRRRGSRPGIPGLPSANLSDTPAAAAAKTFGANGWIVAKYENGYLFLLATDTGRFEASSGGD